MADKKAKVSSIESIEHFQKQLITFAEDSLSILDSVKCEVQRLQRKVEYDFPAHIKQNIQKWENIRQDCQREINSSRTSTAKLAAEQQLRQAKQKLKQLQEKLDYLKKAKQNLTLLLPEPMSSLIKTKVFINNDLCRANETLKRYSRILTEYTSEGKSHEL